MTPFHETAPTTAPTIALARDLQALVPVLETHRLILRAPRIEDFDVFADTVLGPQGRFYSDCKTRAEAWPEFLQFTGTWYLRGHGGWSVIERGTDDVVGFFQIGAEPGDFEPELGFLVTPAAEGRSIAFEAASAVRDHAFTAFGLNSLVSYVHPDNDRSARLAERLGALRDAQAESAFDMDVLVYRHKLPEILQ